jgi:hypothetical protein
VSSELDSYVVVRRFVNLQEALVAKSALESWGIDSYVADENTIHLMGSHLGGARLYIRHSDAEAAAASALLKSLDSPTA